jgi:hypothetical protein
MGESIEALLGGRDREHRLYSRSWEDSTFWERITGRLKRVDCLCGWWLCVDTRRFKLRDIYEEHVASEASRRVRTAPRNESLARLIQSNRALLMTPSARIYSLSFKERQNLGDLSGHVREDYEKERLDRPPTRPPLGIDGVCALLRDGGRLIGP